MLYQSQFVLCRSSEIEAYSTKQYVGCDSLFFIGKLVPISRYSQHVIKVRPISLTSKGHVIIGLEWAEMTLKYQPFAFVHLFQVGSILTLPKLDT